MSAPGPRSVQPTLFTLIPRSRAFTTVMGATAGGWDQVKPTFSMKCPSLRLRTPPPARCTMNASRMMARMTTTTQKKNTTIPGMAYPDMVLALATVTRYPSAQALFGDGRCWAGNSQLLEPVSASRPDGSWHGPTLAIDNRIAYSQVVLSSLARQTPTGGLLVRRRLPVNVDDEEKTPSPPRRPPSE